MSTLLEDAVFAAHPHQLSERALEHINTVQNVMGPPAPAPERSPQWATLAQLASQHHASEYSQLKFGHRGCTTRYVPLSLQSPEVYEELRLRQLSSSHVQAWWLTEDTPDAPSLAHALSAAIGEPLPLQPSQSTHAVKTSSTHPINISSIIAPEAIPLISSQLFLSDGQCGSTICEIAPSFTLDRLTGFEYFSHDPAATNSHLRTRSYVSQALQAAMTSGLQPSNISSFSLNVTSETKPPSVTHSLSLSLTLSAAPTPISSKPSSPILSIPGRTSLPESPFTLGNLLLSSCPGKKVRLDGPVKGRSGVCRDLDADLRRMKDMGVGCIVCCLDDIELEFLGSPWAEYEQATRRLGIDILRLPTPEGLPPSLYPSSLNEHLTALIHRYTLRGVTVLVHCRGGVGRAGVVACCWMIRLGLFGSVHYSKALDIVQKAISVVRRRRSLKAIETYEQAKFLVDYVEYLRATSSPPPL